MKQILQSLNNGASRLVSVPTPRVASGEVLVRTKVSLLSAGTERMLVEFGKANLISKALKQPERIPAVLDKVRAEGIASAAEAIASKLEQPVAIGYSNVGRVIECGESIDGIAIGDRVVSNGPHAEFVAVPKNLCARVPDSVSDETASFTVIAAISLQGVRLVNPTLGECVVVIGLGMIGLLAVQLLRLHGCRVLGMDLDPSRLALASQYGAEAVDIASGADYLSAASAFSRGRGVDAVIIAASTTSNDPVSRAAKMCRKRGRIVLVGVAGLELNRSDFYEKELTFQVSCSYGPGRYDPGYEDGGHDYPVGFVRWTEQRNFEAVLDLMASRALDVGPLISHRFSIDGAEEAFALLSSDAPSLGILLHYGAEETQQSPPERCVRLSEKNYAPGKAIVGFLGAGNYAARVLIPAFREADASLHTLVSNGGLSAVHIGRKFGFIEAATDDNAPLENSSIDTVVVATRHGAHASQVVAALRAGKHVYCEKPLCLTLDELAEIESEANSRTTQLLMVGFNRRFSPLIVRAKSLLDQVKEPKCFVMVVNAGAISREHWIQDPRVGGGRVIGEACHFVDLLRYLAGVPIVDFHAVSLGRHPGLRSTDDKSTITLSFADGSVGTIHYFANGHRAFPKERLEIFAGGRILQLDNFRVLRGWGWPRFSRESMWRQDKGAKQCVAAFVSAVRSGAASPIPLQELIETTRVTIELATRLK